MTTHWPNCVFCLLLAVTVVSVQNAGLYFWGLPKVNALTAWKLIAQQLIENKYLCVVVMEQVANDHDVVRCTIFSSQSPQEKIEKG